MTEAFEIWEIADDIAIAMGFLDYEIKCESMEEKNQVACETAYEKLKEARKLLEDISKDVEGSL